jgi:Fic family protein
LITLLLCAEGALAEPLLYLSLYFKAHRAAYYDLLQRVRTEGAWEAWLHFFLTGVAETTEQATRTAQRIIRLFETDRTQIEELGRPASSALRVYHAFSRRSFSRYQAQQDARRLSQPAVTKAFLNLERLGIVREKTGGRRNGCSCTRSYLKILEEGTEPIR